MKKEIVQLDNDLIKQIDKNMGWVEKDGSSPSKTANERGVDCKFISPGQAAWRTRKTGLWSTCIISYGLTTTLLAKSFSELVRLNFVLRQRLDQANRKQIKRWQKYYKAMWVRRYRRWSCKKPDECICQLCRSGKYED